MGSDDSIQTYIDGAECITVEDPQNSSASDEEYLDLMFTEVEKEYIKDCNEKTQAA